VENIHETAGNSQNFLSDTIVLNQASGGKRFANYLIDLIVFYIIAILLFAILAATGITGDLFRHETPGVNLLDRLLTMIILGTLWGITEALFKGRTIGKMITRTRAVNEDGTSITPKTAFLRGFSRVVPFEPFSALGNPSYPWHDKWAHTYVIDEKTSITGENHAFNP
jgi:uncharacterized RDD family membrane protein YckC